MFGCINRFWSNEQDSMMGERVAVRALEKKDVIQYKWQSRNAAVAQPVIAIRATAFAP